MDGKRKKHDLLPLVRKVARTQAETKIQGLTKRFQKKCYRLHHFLHNPSTKPESCDRVRRKAFQNVLWYAAEIPACWIGIFLPCMRMQYDSDWQNLYHTILQLAPSPSKREKVKNIQSFVPAPLARELFQLQDLELIVTTDDVALLEEMIATRYERKWAQIPPDFLGKLLSEAIRFFQPSVVTHILNQTELLICHPETLIQTLADFEYLGFLQYQSVADLLLQRFHIKKDIFDIRCAVDDDMTSLDILRYILDTPFPHPLLEKAKQTYIENEQRKALRIIEEYEKEYEQSFAASYK
jgi:hypothetical protein